jgi:hypothetical protein
MQQLPLHHATLVSLCRLERGRGSLKIDLMLLCSVEAGKGDLDCGHGCICCPVTA